MTTLALGTFYTLTPKDNALVARLVAERAAYNARPSVKCRKVGPTDPREIDIMGFGGELAFAWMTGGRWFNTAGVWTPWDVILLDGRRVDVKTNKFWDGRLTAQEWKADKPDVDLYALMIWHKGANRFYFRGVMARDELLRPGRFKQWPPYKNKCYGAEQWELLPLTFSDEPARPSRVPPTS